MGISIIPIMLTMKVV